MRTLLLIIAILIVLGIFASCVVLISIGISSRKLLEFRNELEKEKQTIIERS